MNWIFLTLVLTSVLAAAFNGQMTHLTEATLTSANDAVKLALGLVGQMTLWLGFVGVLREAGLLTLLSRGLKPVMTRLFPEVPAEHPAMGAMIMNLAANVLGLGNAATPFGLKAMQELDTLNPKKGVATDAMALFLALNTGGLAVIPMNAIAVRAATGSRDAAGIIVPTILTSLSSTVVAVLVARLLAKRRLFAADRSFASPTDAPVTSTRPVDVQALHRAESMAAVGDRGTRLTRALALAVAVALTVAVGRFIATQASSMPAFELFRQLLSSWLLPLMIAGIVTLAFARGAKVYEAFLASAKEGFQTAVSIIPFLVAMLVAIGMLRASGAMEVVVTAASLLTSPLGFPPEALPMALIRPLSGSGALAVMSDALKAYGPDSFVGYLVSVINGGTETTFYVLALYFGAVQVRVIRHTLPACLAADLAGPTVALLVCRLFFGSAPMVLPL